MDIKFDFENLSFLANLQTTSEYTKLGFTELFSAAQMSGGDHSHFFNAFGLLIEQLEEISGKEMDLSFLLTLRSDNGVPSVVYGGALQVHPEIGLSLTFGDNLFPVTQSGKTLSIGTLSGELKITDKKREDQSVYWNLFWEVALTDDYDVFFAIPIAKDPADPKGVAPLHMDKDIFKKDVIAKNNLVAYTRAQSVGGGLYTNFGHCPRVDGLGNPIKPKEMADGTYILVGIAYGRPVNKEDGKEFDSVIGYLADGTRISLNSYAQKDFLADLAANEARLEDLKKRLGEALGNDPDMVGKIQAELKAWVPTSYRFPLQWKMHHLDANRTRSTLCNISAPVATKTVLPSRFAAFANTALPSAPEPTKSALVGGSSADFDKLVEAQTTPTKSAVAVAADGSSADDIPF
jgi:hypothetical protein